ncbi:Receptor-interacting serine/threonine-protein kinase 3 [Tulasnella sp. 417]|nr:Receptor-interacting serine/threonine-protein kinase 3 [Tulasnella sp. 417]
MDDPDLQSLNRCLQGLKYLYLDIDRIVPEEAYEGKRGGFGDVQVSTLDPGTPSAKLVVAKTVRLVHTKKRPHRFTLRFARELWVWAGLDHSHILSLLGYYLDKDRKIAILISDYMSNGDLKEYLEIQNPSWNTRLGLRFKAGEEIVVLCFPSMLTSSDATPGKHTTLQEEGTGLTTSTGLKGTLRYYSPELILEAENGHSLQSDIWAFGCLLLEANTIPYAQKKTDPVVLFALAKKEAPANLASLSIPSFELRALLGKCWNPEPIDRPSAQECLAVISSLCRLYDARANKEGEWLTVYATVKISVIPPPGLPAILQHETNAQAQQKKPQNKGDPSFISGTDLSQSTGGAEAQQEILQSRMQPLMDTEPSLPAKTPPAPAPQLQENTDIWNGTLMHVTPDGRGGTQEIRISVSAKRGNTTNALHPQFAVWPSLLRFNPRQFRPFRFPELTEIIEQNDIPLCTIEPNGGSFGENLEAGAKNEQTFDRLRQILALNNAGAAIEFGGLAGPQGAGIFVYPSPLTDAVRLVGAVFLEQPIPMLSPPQYPGIPANAAPFPALQRASAILGIEPSLRSIQHPNARLFGRGTSDHLLKRKQQKDGHPPWQIQLLDQYPWKHRLPQQPAKAGPTLISGVGIGAVIGAGPSANATGGFVGQQHANPQAHAQTRLLSRDLSVRAMVGVGGGIGGFDDNGAGIGGEIGGNMMAPDVSSQIGMMNPPGVVNIGDVNPELPLGGWQGPTPEMFRPLAPPDESSDVEDPIPCKPKQPNLCVDQLPSLNIVLHLKHCLLIGDMWSSVTSPFLEGIPALAEDDDFLGFHPQHNDLSHLYQNDASDYEDPRSTLALVSSAPSLSPSTDRHRRLILDPTQQTSTPLSVDRTSLDQP